MKHAVIYARFSSNNQREESIDGQIRVCTKYAEENNMSIIKVYVDRALSGRTTDRPQYKLMLEDAKRNKFDYILVWKNDRISRNRYDMAKFRASIKKNNVELISITELIPDSPEGVILESVLDGMAEYYSLNLAQNTLRGMNENALKCKFNGGSVPLGYKIDKENNFLIHEEQAEIVRKIFEKYHAGETITNISKWLKSSKIKPNSHGGVANILKNEKYIGTYKFRDIEIEDGIPAIIDKNLFYSVQKMREQNKNRNFRTMDNYLLTGKLQCGICGGTIRADSGTSRNGTVYKYYNCQNSRGKDKCEFQSLNKDDLEDFVLSQIKEIIFDDELIELIATNVILVQEEQFEKLELDVLEDRLAENEKQTDKIINAIANGAYNERMNKQLEDLK